MSLQVAGEVISGNLVMGRGGVSMALSSTGKMALAWAILNAMSIPHLRAGNSRDEQPVRVEFRILADSQHDRAAAERAKAPESFEHPPAGYRWVWLGQVVMGSDPTIGADRLTMTGAHWKDDEFAGGTVRLTGKNLAGSDLTRDFEITSNTAKTLQVRPNPALFLKSASSFRIDLTPSRVDLPPGTKNDLVMREAPESTGRFRRLILVKLDRHNVTDKDFTRILPDFDERLRPAIRFELSRQGARRFGALTREHLPEANGTFKYHLGIILDGRLLSAPVINSEIRDSGIIEGGAQGFKPNELELIIKTLRGSRD
jgi:SecD/SecF fusion protein